MALRPTPLGSAEHVEWYFKNEWRNGQSEYYAKAKGVWYGKVKDRLELSPEIDRKEFAALLKNKRPNGERLTQRTNKGCKKMVWELDEVSQSRVRVEKEVANRRVAVDWTVSVPKDISVYLAATHDPVVEKIVHRAVYECLDALQGEMETQVQKGGQQANRVTGEALFAVFVHRETRPVDGIPDPHYHVHALQINVTYDQVEERFKAGNIRFNNKSLHEERFHARVWDDMRDAGYGFRRTAKGLEMTVLNPGEKAIFEKRTRAIEAIAHSKGPSSEPRQRLSSRERPNVASSWSTSRS
jgi:conjugative relaxase-like TrwC/TraI family protein